MARRGDNPIQPVADAIGNITHAYTSTVKIVVFGAIVLGGIRDVESLRAVLEMVRAQVQAKGYRMAPLKIS